MLPRYAPRMRRYSVREAPRAILTQELAEHIRGAEHLHPEQPERADAYRRALQEIEMGALSARARNFEYRVNEELSRRYGVTEGSRDEIMAELEQYAADRAQQGKHVKAGELRDGMMALGKGSREVRVEHIVYRVVED